MNSCALLNLSFLLVGCSLLAGCESRAEEATAEKAEKMEYRLRELEIANQSDKQAIIRLGSEMAALHQQVNKVAAHQSYDDAFRDEDTISYLTPEIMATQS